MKYENLFKIYIPEPCHEDWDKMTPNQQGAYCKVCAKTVVDFSVKSENEIQRYLNENINTSICGRFRMSQLDNPAEEQIPRLKIEKPKFEFPGFLIPVLTPFRATALAMMLFASVALQSCGNSDGAGGDDKRLAGTIEMVDTVKVKPDTAQYNFDDSRIQGGVTPRRINNDNNIKDSTCSTDVDLDVVGKMRYIPPVDTIKADTTETMLKGEIQKKEEKTHGVLIKKENKK